MHCRKGVATLWYNTTIQHMTITLIYTTPLHCIVHLLTINKNTMRCGQMHTEEDIHFYYWNQREERKKVNREKGREGGKGGRGRKSNIE